MLVPIHLIFYADDTTIFAVLSLFMAQISLQIDGINIDRVKDFNFLGFMIKGNLN